MDYKSKEFPTKADYLKFRESYISSTEGAALLHCGAWASYYKLWHLKSGVLGDDFQSTEQTEAGLMYEQVIAKHFAEKYQCETRPITEYRYNDEYKLGASYDFLVTDGAYAGYILETKNMISLSIKNWNDGEPPAQYKIQCQQQMAFYPEAKGVILCALVDGWKLELFIIERDQSLVETLKTEALKFWQSIEEGSAPELDLDDHETVKRVHAKTDGTEETASAESESLILELVATKAQIKALDDKAKKLQAELMASSEAGKIRISDGRYLDMTESKPTAGKMVTQDEVGTFRGARKGFRRCQIRGKKK